MNSNFKALPFTRMQFSTDINSLIFCSQFDPRADNSTFNCASRHLSGCERHLHMRSYCQENRGEGLRKLKFRHHRLLCCFSCGRLVKDEKLFQTRDLNQWGKNSGKSLMSTKHPWWSECPFLDTVPWWKSWKAVTYKKLIRMYFPRCYLPFSFKLENLVYFCCQSSSDSTNIQIILRAILSILFEKWITLYKNVFLFSVKYHYYWLPQWWRICMQILHCFIPKFLKSWVHSIFLI